jgi:hypothetical protein
VKIQIQIRADSFNFEGEVEYPAVEPAVAEFYKAIQTSDAEVQKQIDAFAARNRAQNERLATTVARDRPEGT